jgi:hypothetical protein
MGADMLLLQTKGKEAADTGPYLDHTLPDNDYSWLQCCRLILELELELDYTDSLRVESCGVMGTT